MRGPFAGSIGLHVIAVLIMIFGSRLGEGRKTPLPQATNVRLVRPMATPVAAPTQKQQSEPVIPESKPPLEIPKEKKEKSEAKPVEIPDKPKPRSVLPKLERRGESGNVLKLQNPGFDYDFYLGSVQAKIEQFFRPPTGVKGQYMTTVGFVIQKDGSVSDIQLVKNSGNSFLDLAAERAIRAAGKFGRLPAQYEQNQLIIHYEFVLNPSGK